MNSGFDNLYPDNRRLNLILHFERKTIYRLFRLRHSLPLIGRIFVTAKHAATLSYPFKHFLWCLHIYLVLDLMQVQLSNLSRLGTKFPFPLPASHSSIATIHREMLNMDPVGRATDASCHIPPCPKVPDDYHQFITFSTL